MTSFTESGVSAGDKRVFKAKLSSDTATAGKFVRLRITASDATYQDTCAIKLSDTEIKELWCVWEIPVAGDVTYSVVSVDLANTNIVYVDDVVGTTYELPVWSVDGRKILFNGQPVYFRGVNYNNTPTEGASNTNWGDEDRMLLLDMADLADQGVNCLRFYNNSWDRNDYGRALSAAMQYGMTCQLWYFIWIQSNDARQSTGAGQTYRQSKVDDYVVWINRLKDHPAMSIFAFGSEGNYHVADPGSPGENNTQQDWFTLIDACSAAGKEITRRVLFSTSNGGTPNPSVDDWVPHMDVWGYTVYGGNSGQVYRGSTLSGRKALIENSTTKPAFLTEIGSGCYQDGYADGNQAYQSQTDIGLISTAEAIYPWLSGTLYFQYSDDRGDTSWYGKAETVAAGTSVTRTKRTGFTQLKRFYQLNRVPNNA